MHCNSRNVINLVATVTKLLCNSSNGKTSSFHKKRRQRRSFSPWFFKGFENVIRNVILNKPPVKLVKSCIFKYAVANWTSGWNSYGHCHSQLTKEAALEFGICLWWNSCFLSMIQSSFRMQLRWNLERNGWYIFKATFSLIFIICFMLKFEDLKRGIHFQLGDFLCKFRKAGLHAQG